MRLIAAGLLSLMLYACGETPQQPPEPVVALADSATPPPSPEGAETVEFERAAASNPTSENTSTEPQEATDEAPKETIYWGVKEGEAMSILWEDLMPEGSEEELMREYEEFYAMLEKRYAARTTTLADADPYAAIAEGSEFDFMPQLGNFDTVEELDGELVRIPGYVVPFDFNTDKKQTEFLFVPYMGACIHTPPPPPNQIIFVRADPAETIKDIWVPYWIEGTLATEKTENELGDTAYALALDKIEPYGM